MALAGVPESKYKSSRSKSSISIQVAKEMEKIPIPKDINLLQANFEKQMEISNMYSEFFEQFLEMLKKSKSELQETCTELGIEVTKKTSSQKMLYDIYQSLAETLFDDSEKE